MTEMIIFNAQRAITQKVSNQDLVLIFCRSPYGASHLCKVYKYITRTVIFNVQRPITQKVIKPDLYMSSSVALYFCKALRKSLEPFSSYRKGTSI